MLDVPPVVIGDDQFRDRRGLLDGVVAVVDAGLVIDAEMRRAAGVGVIILIAADRIAGAVLVPAIGGGNDEALRELDAGGALGSALSWPSVPPPPIISKRPYQVSGRFSANPIP